MAIGAEIKLESRGRVYPLCPMQEGMLFHALRTSESGVDICQVIVDCPEGLDGGVMERAWQKLAERHAVLRTSFRWEGLSEPRQEVHAHIRIPVIEKDWPRQVGPPLPGPLLPSGEERGKSSQFSSTSLFNSTTEGSASEQEARLQELLHEERRQGFELAV